MIILDFERSLSKPTRHVCDWLHACIHSHTESFIRVSAMQEDFSQAHTQTDKRTLLLHCAAQACRTIWRENLNRPELAA